MIFDPEHQRIILETDSVNVNDLWSEWVDWAVQGDNLKYLPVLSQTGGDDLGGGRYSPINIFLLNGWRIRPMEANHYLSIIGNLTVDNSNDSPVVFTLGQFNVIVQYTVPVLAQAISTGDGGFTSADRSMLSLVPASLVRLNK